MTNRSSVRFGEESLNTVHHYEAPENPKEFWVSSESLQRMERKAKDAGRETMQNGLAMLMENTFAKPHRGAQESLNLFVDNADARGVERVICESHFKERKEHKLGVFRRVFETQELARKSDWLPDKVNRKLREASLENSYRAKLFARKMAIADHGACYPQQKGGRRSNVLHKPVNTIRGQPCENGRWNSLAVFGCF